MNRCIMIVTENLEDRRILETLLHQGGHETFSCSTSEDMLAAAYSLLPEGILIDPESDKDVVATALQIHNNDRTRGIPFIFLLPARPEMPAFVVRFRPQCIGFLTRPYGQGEVATIVGHMLELKKCGRIP